MNSNQIRAVTLGVVTTVVFQSCGNGAVVENTPVVASIDLSPANHTLGSLGDTVTLTAVARASDGTVVQGVSFIWTVLDVGVTSVTQAGLVTAVDNGTTTVDVRGGGHLSSASITVEQRAVALSAEVPAVAVVGIPLPPVRVSIVDSRDNIVPWAVGIVSVDALGAAITGQLVDTIETGSVAFDSLVIAELSQGVALQFTLVGYPEETTASFDMSTITFESVSAGTVRTCAVDVEHRVWCWGINSSGSLGVERGLEGGMPRWAARSFELRSVTAGDNGVACGISTADELFCWGDPDPPVAEPWRARLMNPQLIWTAVHPSWNHSCARAGGDVWCWGQNRFGELGNGSTTESTTLVQVSGGPFSLVHVGLFTTCGIGLSNDLYCWGENIGFVSDTTSEILPQYETPQRALDTLNFLSLGGVGSQICGVTTDGNVVCFGGSNFPADLDAVPQLATIAGGTDHMCGLTPNGVAYCWGVNAAGQLGDGLAGVDRAMPGPVAGALLFESITAGGSFTCGVALDGFLYCWGANNLGQLGDGTHENRDVPTLVLGQG